MRLSQSSTTPISAQSVTRIEGSGTTVYQCCTQSQRTHDCVSFVSSSRNSNKTTLRSSLHAECPSMSTRGQQKRKFGRNGRPDARSIRTKKSVIPEYPAKEFISISFLIYFKKKDTSNYEYYGSSSFETQFDSATRISAIISAQMVFSELHHCRS